MANQKSFSNRYETLWRTCITRWKDYHQYKSLLQKRVTIYRKTNTVARSIQPSIKHQLNTFDKAASELTYVGKQNIRTLRGWAKSKGWQRYSESGKPEMWGVLNHKNKWEWRLNIKPLPNPRPQIAAGSKLPRFDARFNKDGNHYVNPFIGKLGNKCVGSHLPLNKRFY